MIVTHFATVKEMNQYLKGKDIPIENIRTLVTPIIGRQGGGVHADYFVIEKDDQAVDISEKASMSIEQIKLLKFFVEHTSVHNNSVTLHFGMNDILNKKIPAFLVENLSEEELTPFRSIFQDGHY